MSYPATEGNLRLGAGREINRLKNENAALKAENDSLKALAWLGRWCLTEQFSESDEVFRYAMDYEAENLGLALSDRDHTLTDKAKVLEK